MMIPFKSIVYLDTNASCRNNLLDNLITHLDSLFWLSQLPAASTEQHILLLGRMGSNSSPNTVYIALLGLHLTWKPPDHKSESRHKRWYCLRTCEAVGHHLFPQWYRAGHYKKGKAGWGPSRDPCGTPKVTGITWDWHPLIVVTCVLPQR